MNQTIVTVPSYICPTYAYAAQPMVATQATNTVNTHAQPVRIKQQPQLLKRNHQENIKLNCSNNSSSNYYNNSNHQS